MAFPATPAMEKAPVPSVVPLKVFPAPSSRVMATPERGLAEVSLTVPLTVTVTGAVARAKSWVVAAVRFTVWVEAV